MTRKDRKNTPPSPVEEADDLLEDSVPPTPLEIPEEDGPEGAEGASADQDDSAEAAVPRDGEKAAENAGEELPPFHKVSRKEVLQRLLEKNEIIIKLSKENALRERQLKELNDKWLRSVAEFENYRKRTRKEWELLKQQAKSEVILDILHVIDDFERAFSVADEAEKDEFLQGIRLIYNNLKLVLERTGVQEIEALHEPFDPNYHMAVGQLASEDAKPGMVVEVVQKGYRMDDTVIRPANVIVAK